MESSESFCCQIRPEHFFQKLRVVAALKSADRSAVCQAILLNSTHSCTALLRTIWTGDLFQSAIDRSSVHSGQRERVGEWSYWELGDLIVDQLLPALLVQPLRWTPTKALKLQLLMSANHRLMTLLLLMLCHNLNYPLTLLGMQKIWFKMQLLKRNGQPQNWQRGT